MKHSDQAKSLHGIQKNSDKWFLLFYTRATQSRNVRKLSLPDSRNTLKRGFALRNLTAAAKKHPEVVVKIPKRRSQNSKGLNGVKNHMAYISRNGEIGLENHLGEELKGITAINGQLDNWRQIGIPNESKRREALNIVLSMPKYTDPDALLRAARTFAAEQFAGHEYVFALHHHSQREGEPEHPHVHLCVLMQNENQQRLNPRKGDLFEWRIRFADKLREQGIECAATNRQHRGKTQKQPPEKGIGKHYADNRTAAERGKELDRLKSLVEALAIRRKPENPFIQQLLETRQIMVGEYGKISRDLYMAGYKAEARLLSKFAREVAKQPQLTHQQDIYAERFPQQPKPHTEITVPNDVHARAREYEWALRQENDTGLDI